LGALRQLARAPRGGQYEVETIFYERQTVFHS